MGLGLRGAGTDGAPADEVGDVLRGDGIEELGGGGEAEVEDVAEKGAAETEAGGDVVGAVEMRVHDEALPADGGAGFLEVDAHDDQDAVGDFVRECGETPGVVATGGEIMDRARADDQEKAAVVGEDEPVDFAAGARHEIGLGLGLRELGQQAGGRGEGARLDDMDVGSFLHEGADWAGWDSTRKPGFGHLGAVGGPKMGKKSGAPYTPIRCAFAFLVTPKLPAKRGEVLK